MGRRLFSGDLSPLPDHLRCRRSDGRQWRCPQPAKPGLSFCDYHHYQVRRNQDFSNNNDAAAPAAAEPNRRPRLMDNPPLARKRRRRLREDPPAEKPIFMEQREDGQVQMEDTSDAATGIVDVPVMVTGLAKKRRKLMEESPSPSKEPIGRAPREERLVEMEPSDLKVRRKPRFPDQLRCGRWQCEQWAMPGLSFCDYHRLRCKQPNKETTMEMDTNPKQELRFAADPQSSMKRRQRWLRPDPLADDPICTAQREGGDSAVEAPEAAFAGHLPLPDRLRCRRSDGKKWRCPQPSIPSLSFCEYHQMRCKQANLRNTMVASAKSNRVDSLPAMKRRRKQVRRLLPAENPMRMAQNEGMEEAGLETSDYNNPLCWKEGNSKNEEEAARPERRPRLHAAIQDTSKKDTSLPDHLRCRRSDGRGWRCHKLAMPCLGFCEYHYLQLRRNQKNNKKTKFALAKCKLGPLLAASSLHERKLRRQQLREELSMQEPIRLAQKGGEEGIETPDIEVTRDLPHGVMAISQASVRAPANAATSLNLKIGNDDEHLLGRRFRSKNADRVPLGTHQRLPFSRSVGGGRMRICHRCRCRENKVAQIIGCLSCHEFFCTTCIETWHPHFSQVQVKMCCPVCRGCCSCINCHFVRDEDGGSKELVIHQNKFSTTKCDHHLICHLIPLVKHINGERITELEAEASNQGRRLLDVQIRVAKYTDEEQVNCNHCGSKINDFYRSCSMCTYRFCFSCCHKIRGGSLSKGNRMAPCKYSKRRHPYYRVHNAVKGKKVGFVSRKYVNTLVLCTSTFLPDWTTNNDGSISCPPKVLGGCGDGILNIYFAVTSDSAA